jgi:hypothetical protein
VPSDGVLERPRRTALIDPDDTVGAGWSSCGSGISQCSRSRSDIEHVIAGADVRELHQQWCETAAPSVYEEVVRLAG